MKAAGKKRSRQLLKLILLIVALWLLVQRLDIERLLAIQIKTSASEITIVLLLFLMIWAINFSLDALAWRKVQSIVRPITLWEAMRHNLKSYALAFITPLNSGELAGRYLVQTEKEHRQKTVFLTFWTHAPKLFSKILVALPLFILAQQNDFDIKLSLALALGVILLLLIYFHLEKLISTLERWEIRNLNFKNHLVKGRPLKGEKLAILLINTLRFLCFSTQLATILYILDPAEVHPELLMVIPLFYFFTAIVPTWSAFDFLIKGTVSLYFFQFFSQQEELFLVASTVVWFFNKAIPSFIGLVQFNATELEKFRKRPS